MTYTLTPEQLKALEALAYWVADVNYITERFGHDEPEHETAHKTVLMWFEDLDRLNVPFWVQNTVIAFAENWRRYKSEYLTEYLITKNIYTA